MSLSLQDISCVRGGRLLFSDMTFGLEKGEALFVRGANGSGKSSLLRLIAGLLYPASGKVKWAPEREDAPLQTQLHYLGHLDGLKPTLTVRETLIFWANMLGGVGNLERAQNDWRLDRLMDLPCGVLSAGQRRRVALAQLSLTGRPLWLLDEPTGPLDDAGVDLVTGAVRAHCGNGGVAIIATHRSLDLSEAKTFDLSSGSQAGGNK